MAHNNQEIEIKISLNETEFHELRVKLGNIARFVKKTEQEDTYFTPYHKNFMQEKHPFEWLSIRKRGQKNILNYKHFYPEDSPVFTHCDEFESEINDFNNLKKIFLSLDIKELVIVNKTRETYKTEEFEIALDNITDLGHFVEIEAIKDFGDVSVAREKLFLFAKSLGLDVTKTLNFGYPYLLMKKRGFL